jgi:hypothetical protein
MRLIITTLLGMLFVFSNVYAARYATVVATWQDPEDPDCLFYLTRIYDDRGTPDDLSDDQWIASGYIGGDGCPPSIDDDVVEVETTATATLTDEASSSCLNGSLFSVTITLSDGSVVYGTIDECDNNSFLKKNPSQPRKLFRVLQSPTKNDLGNIEIYPNTVDERLVLRNLEQAGDYNFKIIGINGANWLEKKYHVDSQEKELIIDVSFLDSGIYFIQINSNGLTDQNSNFKTIKFIKL